MHADRHHDEDVPPRRRRATALAMLSAAAVLLHAALLGGLDGVWPAREAYAQAPAEATVAAPALEVRALSADAVSPAAATRGDAARRESIAADAVRMPPPASRVSRTVAASVSGRDGASGASVEAPAAVASERAATGDAAGLQQAAMPSSSSSPSHTAIAANSLSTDAKQTSAAPDAGADAPFPAADATLPDAAAQRLAAATPRSRPDLASTAPAPDAVVPVAASEADMPVPRYRTRLPAAATVRYVLSRGMLHGTGELQWRPQGDRYEIRLEGRLGSLTLLTQVSTGGFDADGIAPQRFTDARLRRSALAANFQRDAGRISFSGSEQQFPLQPGVQDRVSWMVQLAAIVAAQPALRTPGAKVVMRIVGAHADVSVWAFTCLGREGVDTGIGRIDAVKYARESPGGYETTAVAWLDPAHQFLPARATLRSGPKDEGYELQLQEFAGP